jgi:hypothetical protein
MEKKAIDFKIEAESYLWKYGGDDNDKKIATKLFIDAIYKKSDGSMNNIQIADCYNRLGFSYIDKVEKDEYEDFNNVRAAFVNVLSINVPSWYDKSNIVRLLINPCRFGFNIKHKDIEYAKKIGISGMDAGTLYQIACSWTHYNDATEEEIDFAYYYFDHIVKYGVNYHNNTHAMAYCRMAMIYAYNRKKSIENFNKASDLFKKSINTPNFLESKTDQVCIPYCQYSIFLSRTYDFGFPKECNNEEAEVYKKQIDEVCIKDPSFLYFKAGEQYHFHKFANQEYFDISEKYYNNALKSPDIQIHTKIIINHYLADIYTNKRDKSIANYIKGIEYSYQTVILSIENHNLNNVTIGSMQTLLSLLYDPEYFNFDILYIDHDNIKSIKDIKNKIINIKDYYDTELIGVLNKVIEVFHKVNVIKLKNNDIIFKDRQKKVIDQYLSSNNHEESKDLDDFISTKKKLALIEENSDLYEYYDGFMRTFVQVYAISVIIKSGQLSLNTDNLAVTISTKLVSLIPLIGDQISSTAESIWTYIRGVEMINKAVNVVKFSTTSEQFNELVQEAIIDIIIKNKDKLLKLKEESTKKSLIWYEKIQKFCESMKVNIEESVYVQELETPMQKLGSKDATKLISEFLSNGKIYNGELAIKIPINIKKDRLINYALIIYVDKECEEVKENNETVEIEETKIGEVDEVEVVNIDSCSYMKYFYNFSWMKKSK